MPAPTKAALERKPQAVIIQQFVSKSPDTVYALDYEWFETDAGRSTYFTEIGEWCADDVSKHGDVFYTVTEVTDTATMALGQIQGFGPNEAWNKTAAKQVKADVTTLVAPAVAAKKAAAKSTGSKKKAVVKPRKASAASAVVKGTVEVTDETPKPKAKVVRKKTATPKQDSPAAAPGANGSEARAATLKKRLAARKAEEAALAPAGPKTD